MCRRNSSPSPLPVAAPGISPGTSATVKVWLSDPDHAEVRHQRGERVVGDLRLGRGDHRDQRRLAGRREADQADVGDALELQHDVQLLARLAELGEARRLAPGVGQRGVAPAAAAAPGHLEGRAGADHVGEHRAVRGLHDRAVGHLAAPGCGRWRRPGCEPAPPLPFSALTCGRKWKSSRVVTCGSTTSDTLPPCPPLPPSGPPKGLNFSRWIETQPCPPSPACRCRTTRSTNVATSPILPAGLSPAHENGKAGPDTRSAAR